MRTKTLLVTAALVAAGVATSMAQVYSKNVVGYVTKTIHPGYNLICNPLVQTDSSLNALLPNVPEGTVASTFDQAGNVHINTFIAELGGWDPEPALTLDLGKGLLLQNNGETAFPITFVGEVFQGTGAQKYSNDIQLLYSFHSSPVPQATNLVALGVLGQENDVISTYVNTGVGEPAVGIFQFIGELGGWDPEVPPNPVGAGPTIQVGDAFIYLPAGVGSKLVREFVVPTP